ncbi:MAG TPA: DUF2062 domain-containing protein [Candidatus Margulisiibacteriota bacterium]|nr:DUF2062 domain-containing protein [Candidatus Margulisiibacteriota bacterium]
MGNPDNKQNKKDTLKLPELLKLLYLEIFKINDSPQKIALGFSIGIFTGVFPGIGPMVALFLAFLLRANRASALFGSLLTNTWVSFLVFIFAIRLGAHIFDVHWKSTLGEWNYWIKTLHWKGIFHVSLYHAILPTLLGYLIISLILALLAYLLAILLLKVGVKEKNRG